MKKNVYLAGKIDGLDSAEAMKWRYYVKDLLYPEFNAFIPPYSIEPGHNNLMWDRDYYFVDNSDFLIVNFDYEKDSPFLGTSMEIARAFYQRKPIIIFSSKQWVKESLTLKYHATCIVDTIEEAVDFAKSFI